MQLAVLCSGTEEFASVELGYFRGIVGKTMTAFTTLAPMICLLDMSRDNVSNAKGGASWQVSSAETGVRDAAYTHTYILKVTMEDGLRGVENAG